MVSSRKPLSLIVLPFIATIWLPTPIAAQPADIVAMLQRYRAFFDAGNFPAALVEAQKLEATVKARYGDTNPNYGITLGLLSTIYTRQGNYRAAEDLLKRVLAI